MNFTDWKGAQAPLPKRNAQFKTNSINQLMPFITLATLIAAPPAVCFDLARDAQLHVESAQRTGERIVAGRDKGLWELGDEITFEGAHLGVRQRFSARVVAFERPYYFRDEMTRGAFASLSHGHVFEPLPNKKTRMIDSVEWRAPLGLVGAIFTDAIIEAHLTRFLRQRAWHLKEHAENDLLRTSE